ncbi:MAG TPA: nuclear transport factor 2 family protein [Gemmatimonadales bacterium]|nr:nuclear transport factor 2 family protein [Gemmatimonadales bacterium]
MPSTPFYRELLDTFGEAWQAADIDRLVSVFATDAVFLETPFSHKDVGIGAIRAYWQDLPSTQAEVSFRSGEIFEVGPWFATEFRCTFRRRRSGEWVDARGAIFCETKDGKISEMRMYWHRYAGGKEEPKP